MISHLYLILSIIGPGCEETPALISKQVIQCHITPLVFSFHQSIIGGRGGGVISRFKKYPKLFLFIKLDHLWSYQIIDLYQLFIFSKVFEKLMYNSLVSYFDNYNILNQNQFGFLQGHSSHHALNTLVNKITKSLDTGDMVIEIFLDLKSFWNSNLQTFC